LDARSQAEPIDSWYLYGPSKAASIVFRLNKQTADPAMLFLKEQYEVGMSTNFHQAAGIYVGNKNGRLSNPLQHERGFLKRRETYNPPSLYSKA